jgi:hypothetical protein
MRETKGLARHHREAVGAGARRQLRNPVTKRTATNTKKCPWCGFMLISSLHRDECREDNGNG